MLDLDLLRSFVSVVEAGGFTRAGERVHRTQSTVSQQIKRLEEDIGQVLLHRDGKDVRPTGWRNCWALLRARIQPCGSMCVPTRARISPAISNVASSISRSTSARPA